MRGLQSVISLFRNEFNKFLKLLTNRVFDVRNAEILLYYTRRCKDVNIIALPKSVLSILMHSQTRLYMIKKEKCLLKYK